MKEKERERARERAKERKEEKKKNEHTLHQGKGVRGVRRGGKEKSISFGASARGHLLT